jgi:F-type H+-transporting ATPase subunit b
MIADLQQQLGINSSFFQQFLIFMLVFAFLRAAFFAPFLRLIEKRENQSEGLTDEAAKLHEESTRLEAEYRDVLSAARKRAGGERESLLAAARKQGAETVASARAQSKAKLEQAREAAAKSSESELAGLKGQVGSISSLLVDKLMSNKVGL